LRLGREIGVSFQLLDDLSELAEENVTVHEKEINPFINTFEFALNELQLSHKRLMAITSRHNLIFVNKMLQDYFLSNQKKLLKDFALVEKNIGRDLTNLKKWITSFV